MERSIGCLIQEECHKASYGKVNRKLISFNELSLYDQTLLKLRLNKDSIETVCEFHEKKFLLKFNHLYGQSCSDPFEYHANLKKKGSKGCMEIRLEHLEKLKIKI